jgi:hypothetical protein
MKSILDFLKDHSGILVPFLGAYFLVYGVTEMTTFYHEFGIEITDYFYVSDFLTVILGDLPLLVVFSFGLTYGFYLVDRFTTIPAEGLIERKRLLRIWIWDIISVILICIGILVLVAVAFESNYLITAICLYLIVGVSMFGFSNHWVKRLILHRKPLRRNIRPTEAQLLLQIAFLCLIAVGISSGIHPHLCLYMTRETHRFAQ